MHNKVKYGKRLTPAFDAVQDVKDWFGPKWDEVSAMMSQIKDVQTFAFYADFGGVSGYPVEAWYELYHGQGSWAAASCEQETRS